jgi:hypothetical protein
LPLVNGYKVTTAARIFGTTRQKLRYRLPKHRLEAARCVPAGQPSMQGGLRVPAGTISATNPTALVESPQ